MHIYLKIIRSTVVTLDLIDVIKTTLIQSLSDYGLFLSPEELLRIEAKLGYLFTRDDFPLTIRDFEAFQDEALLYCFGPFTTNRWLYLTKLNRSRVDLDSSG